MVRALDFDTDAITSSEILIYRAFLRNAQDRRGDLLGAVLLTRTQCEIPRSRVMEVVRKLNPQYTPEKTKELYA